MGEEKGRGKKWVIRYRESQLLEIWRLLVLQDRPGGCGEGTGTEVNLDLNETL